MFKPMKAATMESESQLRFPLLGSFKLDGFRCILNDGAARTKSLKPIRNKFIQSELRQFWNTGLDGEIVVGSPCDGLTLNRTQSGVTATFSEPDFQVYVFDHILRPLDPYATRFERVRMLPEHPRLKFLRQVWLTNLADLQAFEVEALGLGYEGIIVRCPRAPYKYGRATPNENYLWKIKRFTDGEAYVESILEGETNNNEATRNAAGEIERATVQANMSPNGLVGTLKCRDYITNELYDVSPGRMTHAWRKYYFENPQELLGQIIKHKSFDYGSVNTARFRTFQALRDADDM